jgi:hypothetical protein
MKIRLIVPNYNRNTSPIVAYGSLIADIAGGFTATQAVGGWKDDQGQLIVEPVTVFDIAAMDRPHATFPTLVESDMHNLAKQIARELFQTCVYLEIDGVVEYVTP